MGFIFSNILRQVLSGGKSKKEEISYRLLNPGVKPKSLHSVSETHFFPPLLPLSELCWYSLKFIFLVYFWYRASPHQLIRPNQSSSLYLIEWCYILVRARTYNWKATLKRKQLSLTLCASVHNVFIVAGIGCILYQWLICPVISDWPIKLFIA